MNKGYFPVSAEDQEQRLQSRSNADIQLAIVERESDDLIGAIGIHKISWVHRTADISIIIGDKKKRGKGYGKEAIGIAVGHCFKKLNLRKLTAGMWSTNVSSEKSFFGSAVSKSKLQNIKLLDGLM